MINSTRRIFVDVYPVSETEVEAKKWGAKVARQFVADGTRNTLSISFQIEQTILGLPNQSVIKLYNLSQDSRSYLSRPNLKVELSIGVAQVGLEKEKVQELYSGGIIRCVSERKGTEIETTLWCHTFAANYMQSNALISFAAYTPLVDVLKFLCDKLEAKWDDSRVQLPADDLKLGAGGFSFCGQVEEAMFKIDMQFGISTSVQSNGTFQVLKQDGSFERYVEVSHIRKNLVSATPVVSGVMRIMYAVNIVAYLDPIVWPGDSVKLVSQVNDFLNGNWMIHTIVYSGSSFGNDWIMALDCKVKNPGSPIAGSF